MIIGGGRSGTQLKLGSKFGAMEDYILHHVLGPYGYPSTSKVVNGLMMVHVFGHDLNPKFRLSNTRHGQFFDRSFPIQDDRVEVNPMIHRRILVENLT